MMLASGARDALDDDVKRLLVRDISTRPHDLPGFVGHLG